jgi:hypothetical protein
MGRSLLKTTGGFIFKSTAVTLIVPSGGVTPPPSTDTYPWRIFNPTTSPWNVPIDWSVATKSGLGRTPAQLYGATGHAYISSDVAGTMTFYEDSSSIAWSIFDQKNNRTVNVRAPSSLAPANNPTDFNAQLVLLDGTVWDLYGLTINSPGVATCLGTKGVPGSGTGVGDFVTKANAGFRASGFNWAAGAITLRDYSNGIIPHAMVVALSGASLADPFVYPAVSRDATGAYTGTLPQGALMGIPPTTTKPQGMSTIGSLMWDAHRDYGVYVGDRTGGWNWYSNWAPQDQVPNSVVEPLRSAPYDGDKIVSALVRVTHGKPSIPNHA